MPDSQPWSRKNKDGVNTNVPLYHKFNDFDTNKRLSMESTI